MRHRSLLLASFVALATALDAGAARADPDPVGSGATRDPAAADALFWAGRAAADAGDFALACDKFRQSQRLDPSPGTLFNLAHCEDKLGRVASAARHYREAGGQMKDDDRRALFARDRSAALEPRAGRLTIAIAQPPPEGLVVTRDGERVEDASLGVAVAVDPGTFELRVTATGRSARTVEVTLAEGESKTIELEPGPRLRETPPAPLAPRTERGVTQATGRGLGLEPASSGRRAGGWVLVSVGAAGVVLGTVAGAMVLREKGVFDDHCDGAGACRDREGLDAADRGTRWGTVSTVAFATGAIAATVGALLIATARPAAKAAPRGWRGR